MRIPNKFNGYSADNRRLYYDPATIAVMATSLAKGTAVAAPTLATAAAPVLTTAATTAAPALATTAATNLGTTAALEASKQGIMKAGADVMAQEAAKQAVAQGAQQAGTETLKQGILQGADDVAAMSMDEVGALGTEQMAANPGVYNNAGQLTSSYAPPPAAPPGAPPVPDMSPVSYELAAQPKPIANNPIAENMLNKASQQVKLPDSSYQQVYEGGLKPQLSDASLKMPKMPELTTAKAPPSKLMEGFNAAKQMAADVSKFAKDEPLITTGGIMLAQNMMQPSYNQPAKKKYSGSGGSRGEGGNFEYSEPSAGQYTPIFEPTKYYAVGGPIEQMSAQNAVGSNTGYPMANLQTPMYSNPMMSRPMPTNVINPSGDAGVNMYSGEARMATGGKVSAFERMMKEEEARKKQADAQARSDLEEGKSIASRTRPYSRTQTTNTPYAAAVKELQALSKKYGIQTAAPAKTNVDLMGDQDQIEYAANGGIMHGLGGYSDGGRLLKGPGDGVSDSIPAVIGNKQPARLADGEFVIPARIVSELGNGSTEAGARKLYAMMERVQKRRGKTVGKGKVAVNSKADKHLPA
jgi:hypothetical protein